MSSGASGMTVGLISVLEELGIPINIVGGSNTAISLTDSDLFPKYMRVIVSELFIASVYSQMFVRFGWSA
jgi:hypothetical protein